MNNKVDPKKAGCLPQPGGKGVSDLPHKLLLTPFLPSEEGLGLPGGRELGFRLCGHFSLEKRGLHPR